MRGAQILLLTVSALVVAGCCSTDLQRLSTSDLQLRRYELMYCLSQTRTGWDKQPVQTNPHDNVTADLQEKEAIEQEITRRDVTNYHWPTSVTYPYTDDHCHCQDWVVPLKIW